MGQYSPRVKSQPLQVNQRLLEFRARIEILRTAPEDKYREAVQ